MAIWTAILFAASLISAALFMGPIYTARLQTMQTGMPASGAVGSAILVGLLFVLLFTVLWAAVFRAVLRPEERSFAYLRLGMDELRLLGAVLIVLVGGYLAFLVLGIFTGVIVGIIGGAAGLSAGVGIGAILGIALIVGAIWVAVRISLFGPLTLVKRKIIIGPAWSLTQGAFWPLFGAYFVIGLILFVAYAILMATQMGSIIGDMARPTDPAAALRVAEWQAAHYANAFSGGALIVTVLQAIVGGVGMALQAGSTAVAADRLLGGGGAPRDLRAVYE
ncbi:hypothetical protein ACSBM8_00570 [Sphingomonas sp. ASY06-1R]|uniref:hypothetical protein n=1 Tax=Sphingomonas sp. ASY06-1R TaxID=3445771 RepID=UPI003FA21BE6